MSNRKNIAQFVIITLLFFGSKMYIYAQKAPMIPAVDILISGPKYNRQVYKKTDDSEIKISSYDNWELIKKTYISPDQKQVLVYHKPDKASGFLLSLYSLESNTLISEFAPGWACDNIHWTKEYIIWEWGTSGGGVRFMYLDQKLNIIREISSYKWFIDLETDIVIDLPFFGASNGDINIYRYTDGAKIKTVNYKNEIGANYVCAICTKIESGKYKFILESAVDNTKKEIILKL